MLYERLEQLCKERGISISGLLGEIGVSKSSASRWKSKGYEPSNQTLKKIADFFGISVRELLNGPEEKAPAVEARANDEMAELLQEIRDREDLRTLFMLASKTTPEEVRKFIGVIRAIRGEDDGDGVC